MSRKNKKTKNHDTQRPCPLPPIRLSPTAARFTKCTPTSPSSSPRNPQDTARFPHNLITAKRNTRRGHGQGTSAVPAPDVNDEGAFPDINFASSAAAVRQQSQRAAGGGGGGYAPDSAVGGGGGGGVGGERRGGEEEEDEGGWDGEGRIEEAQIVSGR